MEICKILTVVIVMVVFYAVQVKAQGTNRQLMECLQKLMPCQPYIHTVNPLLPQSCCDPMKEIIEKDAPCLCAVFNNPDILKTLNLTKENALKLPKACGANLDVSLCAKNATSPPTPASGSTKGTSSSAPTISFIDGLSFLCAFVAVVLF